MLPNSASHNRPPVGLSVEMTRTNPAVHFSVIERADEDQKLDAFLMDYCGGVSEKLQAMESRKVEGL